MLMSARLALRTMATEQLVKQEWKPTNPTDSLVRSSPTRSGLPDGWTVIDPELLCDQKTGDFLTGDQLRERLQILGIGPGKRPENHRVLMVQSVQKKSEV